MKILIIGQAPPAVKQEYPYDTTLLYEMLSWVGIGKIEAQDIFDFDAVSGEFPGQGKNGHLLPSAESVRKHFDNVLRDKIKNSKKIIVLGGFAEKVLKGYRYEAGTKVVFLIHPSRRNYSKIMRTKGEIFDQLSSILNEF